MPPRLSLSKLLTTISCPLLIVALTSCGGAGGQNNAPTVSLTITPSSITAGQSATLAWTSANATSVVIDQGIGKVSASGSVTVKPSTTATYTATATGKGGIATAQAAVTVGSSTQAAISMAASQTAQAPGELVTLTWNSTNVTTVSFACTGAAGCNVPFGGPDDPVPGPNGTVTVQMPAVAALTPVTYTVTGTGANGAATSSVTINDDPTFPTLAFAASPSSILPTQSTKLFWNATNASSLTIDNGIGAVSAQGGLQSVSPTQTTTYTATAVGTNGTTITAQATVNLPAAGQVAVSLKASTPAIAAGKSSTLQWVTANAASLTIDNGVPVPSGQIGSGNVSVSPASSTTYTATATDSGGHTATASATVTVVNSGDPNQIKHIIIMVQENRSLDSYFGMMDTYRSMKGLGDTFAGLPKDSSGNFTIAIPDHAGTLIKPYHFQTVCHENVPPSWNQSHADVDGGKMDKFLIKAQSTTIDPNGHRAIGFYDWTDLPYYYEAAAQFATSDNYFSSLLGPTVPNRMYIFAGTSFGHIHSDLWPAGGWTQPTIFQRLREAGITFRYYYQDDSIFLAQWNDWPIDKSFVYPISSYFTDVQNSATLPQVIFIERGEHINDDEHPNNNVQNGARFVASTIDALMKSPSWKESAYVLTYDEGGGMYDHVPPVSITVPDNIAPITIAGDAPGGFNVSGFRVPLIVISPFSIPHYVSHTPRDHAALLRFIEDRFGIAPLTARDAASPSMWEFLNLASPSFLSPPTLPAQPASGKACTQADYSLETAGSQ